MTETFDLDSLNTGCWIASGAGHYGTARVIEIAIGLGWVDAEAEALAEEYNATGGEFEDEDKHDIIYEAGDEAVEWLNENRAAEDHCWEWYEGEFFYWKNVNGEAEEEFFNY